MSLFIGKSKTGLALLSESPVKQKVIHTYVCYARFEILSDDFLGRSPVSYSTALLLWSGRHRLVVPSGTSYCGEHTGHCCACAGGPCASVHPQVKKLNLPALWQVAEAVLGPRAALWCGGHHPMPLSRCSGGRQGALAGRGDARKGECRQCKATVMLPPRPPAPTGRQHLHFSPPASESFPRAAWLSPSAFAGLYLHGKTRTFPAPRYQFTIRLKINLRLLLMSIAQRQKNNSYTCSLFVSPAPYGELLMDRGFHRDCLLTG